MQEATVGTVYSTSVPITSSLTLKAVAYRVNMCNSTVTSGAYSYFIGNNGVGASNQTFTAGRMYAARFQAPANVTVASILVNIATSPGKGWKTFALTSGQALTSGSYYWLTLWANGAFAVKGDSTDGTDKWKPQTYETQPISFGTSGGSGTIK